MPSTRGGCCYELLGLTKGCTDTEIKSAYKRLAFLHHPDKNRGSKVSEEKFKQINNAYEILIEPTSRVDHNTKPQPQSSQQRPQGGGYAREKKRRERFRPLYPRNLDFYTENTFIEHAQVVHRNWERLGRSLVQNSEVEKMILVTHIKTNMEMLNRVKLVAQSEPLERRDEMWTCGESRGT